MSGLPTVVRPPSGPLARAWLSRQARGAWSFRLYPDALEGGGCWVPASREPHVHVPAGAGLDGSRSSVEAARRARGKVRRYVVANGCDKLVTLTYRGDGCHDPAQFVADVHEFWVELRRLSGGDVGPYLWVPEWHPGGHGLHAHAGLAKYVPVRLIRAAWPHGDRIDIKRLTGTPVGRSPAVVTERSRVCARYLGKYVGKAFEDTRRVLGRHRYEVAQGFQPRAVALHSESREEVLRLACEAMGADAQRVWYSPADVEFTAMWAAWRAS